MDGSEMGANAERFREPFGDEDLDRDFTLAPDTIPPPLLGITDSQVKVCFACSAGVDSMLGDIYTSLPHDNEEHEVILTHTLCEDCEKMERLML